MKSWITTTPGHGGGAWVPRSRPASLLAPSGSPGFLSSPSGYCRPAWRWLASASSTHPVTSTHLREQLDPSVRSRPLHLPGGIRTGRSHGPAERCRAARAAQRDCSLGQFLSWALHAMSIFGRRWKRYTSVAAGLVLAPALMAQQTLSTGHWVDGSWAVLLMAGALAGGYLVLRRLLATLVVAALVVLGTSWTVAPSLATRATATRVFPSEEVGSATRRRAIWTAPVGRNFFDTGLDQMMAEARAGDLSTRGSYAYSNLGAAIAGQAAAAAAGMSYADLMRTRAVRTARHGSHSRPGRPSLGRRGQVGERPPSAPLGVRCLRTCRCGRVHSRGHRDASRQRSSTGGRRGCPRSSRPPRRASPTPGSASSGTSRRHTARRSRGTKALPAATGVPGHRPSP